MPVNLSVEEIEMNLKKKKILVTGGTGFLGHHVIQKLIESGVSEEAIVGVGSEWDLRDSERCSRLLKLTKPNVVLHLAGNVGGIGLNSRKPAELFYNNIVMGVEIMEAAYRQGVEKLVIIGTICAYPKFTHVPFREEDLWNGYPEETNAAYGIAKKALLVGAQAYRQQYGFNVIYPLLVNLYGPGDNFEENTSHVIPALIKKIDHALTTGQDFIEVWGTGNASREFLYVNDAAEAIVLATERYNGAAPVNIGTGHEISIRKLVETLCLLMEFTGEIRWDATKPDGQPRRCLDVSMAQVEFEFQAKTSLIEGLTKTISWYRSQNK